MRKPIHPIRKLRLALERVGASAMPYDGRELEPVIARHVKPLLDALETALRAYNPNGPNHQEQERLLAAWRAPL